MSPSFAHYATLLAGMLVARADAPPADDARAAGDADHDAPWATTTRDLARGLGRRTVCRGPDRRGPYTAPAALPTPPADARLDRRG